jgi:hypothetical protein
MVQETTKGFPLMFQGADIPIGAKICAAVLVVGAVGFTGSRMLSGGDETAVDASATNLTVVDTLPFVDEPEPEPEATTTTADPGPDTEAPSLAVTSPEARSSLPYSVVRFRGTAEPGSVLSIGDSATTVGGRGSWSVVLELTLGENALVFNATDAAGNVTTVEHTVVVESLGAPEASIDDSPEARGGRSGQPSTGSPQGTTPADGSTPSTTTPAGGPTTTAGPTGGPTTTTPGGGNAPPTTAAPWPFSASQQYGSSSSPSPFERVFGQASPGSTVQISSPYGSATAQVSSTGNWSAFVYFSGAPYDQPFTITITAANGSKTLSFVASTPVSDENDGPGSK